MPEALLRRDVSTLPDMFQYFFNTKVLFIIVNPQPDPQFVDKEMMVQRRWEFESTRGAAFFWNHEDGSFECGNSEHIGDQAMYRLIEEAKKELGEELARNHIRSFEIRPVFALRR